MFVFEETELTTKARAFAENILGKLPATCSYHNLRHTTEVVAAAIEIGKDIDLPMAELELIVIAAWFHDVGYSCSFKNHEDESARIMRETLTEWKIPAEKINRIEKIIKATKMPQSPEDELSKIMCDADLYHFSTQQFTQRSEELRKELINLCGKTIASNDWAANNITFLTNHNYFTTYGKTVLEHGKKKNLKKLRKQSFGG